MKNNINSSKNLVLSSGLNRNYYSGNLNNKYVLTTIGNNPENKMISHSLNLPNKTGYYILNNKLKKQDKNKNIINPVNTLYSNTNGNNSLSSYNLKKEIISDMNPMEMINQMASSNNSNIFSELQINSNEKELNNNNKKTEEDLNDINNSENIKMTYNDGINTLNENISENFSINNNNEINTNNDNDNEEEKVKEKINFNNNSFDDSLEYSKSKSFNNNETPNQSSHKNDLNENIENIKINNKDESVNIYTNFNNLIINMNNNNNNQIKNIERYKNTSSNKSKNDYDVESEKSYGKLSNISNISVFNNKSNKNHHRQISYHNNRQSSNNITNKSYNSKSLNYIHNTILIYSSNIYMIIIL